MFKRVLICNGAHLGDVILSTAVLPVLRSAFPKAELGFLTGSWSRGVLENHALIDHIHIFDHPAINRSPISRRAKKRRGKKSWLRALSEVQSYDYEVAFDLYSCVVPMGFFLYKALIEQRVGHYTSRQCRYYTDLLYWVRTGAHMVEEHGKILEDFGVGAHHLSYLKPTLLYRDEISYTTGLENYIVLHVGVGDPLKEWNLYAWQDLARRLRALSLPIVILGKGVKEAALAWEIEMVHGRALNLVDRLSVRESFEVIRRAHSVIGLDSMAGHVAAAYGVPSVNIYGGYTSITRWRPYNHASIVVAPSQVGESRLSPHAINSVTAQSVFEAVLCTLERNARGEKGAGHIEERQGKSLSDAMYAKSAPPHLQEA